MMLRAVPRQAWRSRDTTRAVIGLTALAVLRLALIQSLVFSVVTASLTHLDLMGWLGLFAVMLAADVTFLFVNAALVALWGNAGRLAAATAANQPVPSTSEAASSEGIRSGAGMPGVATSVPSASVMRTRSAWAPSGAAACRCTHDDLSLIHISDPTRPY